MNEKDYIENYFEGSLSTEEIKLFDERIQNDPAFADEVAFYYCTLRAIESEVAAEKKHRFKELYKQENKEVKIRPLRRWWPYVAAAAVIAGLVAGLFIFTQPSSSKLADHYIQEHFQTLSVTMSSKEDEMQKGLRLYNENKLPLALQQFEKILQSDTSDFVALKNAGIVCLRLEQYDKALNYFTQLAGSKGYYSNPGIFYHAVTLLKRNAAGDKQQAKVFLEQVVNEDLEGKQTAEEWLRKW